jgi:lipid-A-disaccharide synthase
VRDVLFVAGEASGDLHGAGVASAIRALDPERSMRGLGGAHMAAAGVELMERTDEDAVMGFIEVLKHIPRHYALLGQLSQQLRAGKVGVVIPIDYPGFNMKLAARAKETGVPVLYYITPQVWAWGAGRLSKLAKTVTKAAVILPFEEPLLRSHGIDATFVGHPLLDRAGSLPSRSEARATLGLANDRPLLALFPGSRAQEIERHLEGFVAMGVEMQRRHPKLQVVVAAAPTVRFARERIPFPVIDAASFTVLRAADAALCKSGTTTLEAAVADCPLVVAYRTSPWTYRIARRLVTIPHIALVNVVAGREVARELVQDAFQPVVAASILEPLLDPSSSERAQLLAGLAEVRAKLGRPGAAKRVAQMALELAR